MEFKPITSQEELDQIISARLTREREAVAKKYSDYDDLKGKVGTYETQIADYAKQLEEATKKQSGHEKTVAELTAKLKGYETDSVKTRIALEKGLPYELAARLSGDSEDAIRQDAESLAKFVSRGPVPAPLRSSEPEKVDSERAALTKMLQDMKGE